MSEATTTQILKNQFDVETDANRIIDLRTLAVNKGFLYGSYKYIEAGAGVNTYFSLVTPSTNIDVHYSFSGVSTNGDNLLIYIYEDSQITGGTSLPIINFNRQSTNASSATALFEPTIVSLGTPIGMLYVGGGTGQGQNTEGGILGTQAKFILKRDTVYTIEYNNNSALQNNFGSYQTFEEVFEE